MYIVIAKPNHNGQHVGFSQYNIDGAMSNKQ